jgi:hypothetical protein
MRHRTAMATEIAPTRTSATGRSARRRMKVWMTAAPPRSSGASVVLATAAVLLVVSAALHVDLWSSGYRTIPTIGWLFLAQGIATPVVALVLLLTRWLAAVGVALATMVGTLGGFILASTVGLFGFHDGFAAPFASVTFATEIAAIVLLVIGGAMAVRGTPKGVDATSLSHRVDEIFDSVPDSASSIDERWTDPVVPSLSQPPNQ